MKAKYDNNYSLTVRTIADGIHELFKKHGEGAIDLRTLTQVYRCCIEQYTIGGKQLPENSKKPWQPLQKGL